MAEKGCSLDEIVKVARRVAAAMGELDQTNTNAKELCIHLLN